MLPTPREVWNAMVEAYEWQDYCAFIPTLEADRRRVVEACLKAAYDAYLNDDDAGPETWNKIAAALRALPIGDQT